MAIDIANENVFFNKYTGETEERIPYGLYGNVWLSKTELDYLDKRFDVSELGLSIDDIIDEVDAYVEYNSNEEFNRTRYIYRNSFFYIKSWINRRKEYARRCLEA